MTAVLHVEGVDLKVRANSKKHHTKKYEAVHAEPPQAVLRRGQVFTISVTFKERPFQEGQDVVKVIFKHVFNSIYASPSAQYFNPRQGTKGSIKLTKKEEFNNVETVWDALIKSSEGNCLTIEVISPADSPVGEWKLEIETRLSTSQPGEEVTYTYPKYIYLLFNPWCLKDQVYMQEERLLEEYVLNKEGKIWKGDRKNQSGRPWVYGQFDAIVLPAVMLILRNSKMPGQDLHDPVKVSRNLTKMVNSYNPKLHGVLAGNWSGNYGDETAPSSWTGSVPILEQYFNTGREVRFGQCWVFAGVLTTVCRALGIPCRPVTTINSAHDTTGTLSIDNYIFPDKDKIPFDPSQPEGNDSIWNFHVWNDVWIARPDLPAEYSGWQAIDATPQETSDGLYQCGPAPLKAIRRGDLGFKFDIGFILAEVHANVVTWMVDPKNDPKYIPVKIKSKKVGKMVLTKHPEKFDHRGDQDLEDVTEQYKASKGTDDEKAVNKVLKDALKDVKIEETSQDVFFELVKPEEITMGETFVVKVNVRNESHERRTVQLAMSANTVYYNGEKGHVLDHCKHGPVHLHPEESRTFSLTVQSEEYLNKLVEYCIIKLYSVGSITETKQVWMDEHTFQIIKPTINITINKELRKKEPAPVTFKIKNPLNKPLTHCKFYYEGAGLCKLHEIHYREIQPLEEATMEVTLTPKYEGSHVLVVTFDSKEICDVTGSADVQVLET